MTPKLIVCYIGDRASQFIDLSLQSVIDIADKIVFVWGMDDQKTANKVLQWQTQYPDKFVLIANKFDCNDKGMNGRQRSIYLSYLQQHHIGDWALVLDPDEVVSNGKDVVNTINAFETDYLIKNPDLKDCSIIFNPVMEHFIYSLNHVDNTREQHYCPGRMFKVDEHLFYEPVEHAVTQTHREHIRMDINSFTLYHFGYVSNVFDVLSKYKNNKAKTNIHKPEFVEHWRRSHLFGKYPVRKFDISTLPQFILDHFCITDDDFDYYRGKEQ